MEWDWNRAFQIQEREGLPLPLVQLEAGDYLLEALQEAGPTKPVPMGGEQALGWVDVWAYGQATQAIEEPWEYQALMMMSRAYINGKRAGEDPLSLSPLEISEG